MDFDKLFDEAKEVMSEANSNLTHGSIIVDGQDKDDWYVSGTFYYDLSGFDFKEISEDLIKKIENDIS